MITIEANNYPKAAVPQRQEFIGTQTAYIAQFARKLRRYYAKQTQFAKRSNRRNCCYNKGLCQYTPSRTAKKQTQFQPHHPRTAQRIIKMQNKPNFLNAKMNLTTYRDKVYENIRIREPRKNKPNLKTAIPVNTRYTLSQQTLLNNLPGLF